MIRIALAALVALWAGAAQAASTTEPNVANLLTQCSSGVPIIGGGSGANPACWGTGTIGAIAHLGLGTSVADPGTGNAEFLLPVKTNTANGSSCTTSCNFVTSDFFQKTRRSNSGTAMTDSFPASSATGLANGTRIDIANVDATASDTITAGASTTINGSSTYVVPPGRDIWFVYDLANTEWRLDANTGSSLLSANNLSDVASTSTAITNLFGGATGTGNAVRATSPSIATPLFTGLSSGTCASSLDIDSGNHLITGACPGVAASIQVGVTTISSGTTTRVEYNNGGTLGEYAISGTGSVAMTASPTFSGTVTLPDSSTATSSGIGSLAALGVGESVPSAGNVNISAAYKIAGNSVLSSSTLGSGVTASSLTSVGTITTGIWNGTAVAATYGGTDINSSASTGIAQVASGIWSISTTLPSGLVAGSGTGHQVFNVNGGSTNSGDGAYFEVLNNTVGELWIGNTSAILGGTFSLAQSIYTANTLALYASGSTSCTAGLQTSASGVLSCVASAARFKHNIRPLSPYEAMAIVTALKPEQWIYNEDAPLADAGERAVGLVADEVAEVEHRLVGYDERGRPYVIRPDRIVGVLAGAIQNLQGEIEELKERK